MGTRGTITAKLSNGKFKCVYLGYDAYPSHAGNTLAQHYNTQERVDALLEHGDMSSVGERCDNPEGHTYDHPTAGCTIYYGRDRGEDDCAGGIGDTAYEAIRNGGYGKQEFNYLWDGTSWTITNK